MSTFTEDLSERRREPKEVDQKSVDQVRAQFLEDVEANPELYDESDVETIRTDDWQVKRYIMRCHGSNKKAVQMLKDALKFRKSIGLAQLSTADFPAEFFKVGILFESLPDKENQGVMFLRVKQYRQIPELNDLMFKFCVYSAVKFDKETNGKGLTAVLDCADFWQASQDASLAFRLAQTLTRYYPFGKARALVLNLPQQFITIWNNIKGWFPSEYTDLVQFIEPNQIFDYIDRANVPFFLGGDSPLNYYSVPSVTLSDEKLIESGLVDQTRLDQIRTTYKALFDEAEQQSQQIKARFGDKVIEGYEYGITDLGDRTKNQEE